jgi:hypothetical protein
VRFLEPEAEKRQREADAERRRGELLGEEDQPDLAEKIERPPDRPRDQQRREAALDYPRQRPASL